MAEQFEHQQDDEINLAELFASLWSHKFLIGLITGISIFFSGYYAVTVDKEYTASAVFEIKENNANGLNISGELGAPPIKYFWSVNTSSQSLLEIMKREFILLASEKLSLKDDSDVTQPQQIHCKVSY